MELVDEDVFAVEGAPAVILDFADIDDLDENSTGVAFLSATRTGVHLTRLRKKAKKTQKPCCIVCKKHHVVKGGAFGDWSLRKDISAFKEASFVPISAAVSSPTRRRWSFINKML